MPLKTFKYRLYPNKEQQEKLCWTLDRCRELYNAALQERRDTWTVCKQHPNYYDPQWRKEHAHEYSVSYYDQSAQLPEIKGLREEYQDVYAQVLQDVLKRVKKAFDAFFRRVKSGQTPGYPRWATQNRYDSFTYPQAGFSLTRDNRLCLSKIGDIKIKLHREVQGTIKTCTIKREGTHWYVCFACEVETQPKLPYTDEAVGIDLGLLHLATLSTGDTIENPRYYRKSEKKLNKAQQALSRKKRGSNRRKKAVQRVARCHRKVRNQRSDYLHKESRKLVDTYETIVFEDLQAANMVKRPKPKQDEEGKYLPNRASQKAGLNKSIHDAGWAQLVGYTTYKAEGAGTRVLTVNPYKTSQLCSACHLEGPHKDLSERTHTCVHCGVVLDRDHNAALNILRLGLSQRGSNAA
jgi:putative transposase